MDSNDYCKIVLGDEYDEALQTQLFIVLGELGARPKGKATWSLAGSQELSEMDVLLEGDLIHIESETYIGLSVAGPLAVVTRIQTLLDSKRGRAC